MKRIKSVQTPVVALSILMLVGLTVWAILNGDADYSRTKPTLETTEDWVTMGEAAALVLVSYAGVTKVAAIGGEIKNPGKNLPSGIMSSLIIGTVLYAALVATMAAVIPPESFFDSHGHPIEDPVRVFAEIVGGSSVALFAAVVAILTMTSMSLAGILAASRYLFAMSRDSLLPASLEDLHQKYDTPHVAIIITGLAMAWALVSIDVHQVAEFASGFQIMAYMLMCQRACDAEGDQVARMVPARVPRPTTPLPTGIRDSHRGLATLLHGHRGSHWSSYCRSSWLDYLRGLRQEAHQSENLALGDFPPDELGPREGRGETANRRLLRS